MLCHKSEQNILQWKIIACNLNLNKLWIVDIKFGCHDSRLTPSLMLLLWKWLTWMMVGVSRVSPRGHSCTIRIQITNDLNFENWIYFMNCIANYSHPPLQYGSRETRKNAQKPYWKGGRIGGGIFYILNISWNTGMKSKICQNNSLLRYNMHQTAFVCTRTDVISETTYA